MTETLDSLADTNCSRLWTWTLPSDWGRPWGAAQDCLCLAICIVSLLSVTIWTGCITWKITSRDRRHAAGFRHWRCYGLPEQFNYRERMPCSDWSPVSLSAIFVGTWVLIVHWQWIFKVATHLLEPRNGFGDGLTVTNSENFDTKLTALQAVRIQLPMLVVRVQGVKTDEHEAWLKLLERSVLIVFSKKRFKQI